MFNSIERQSVRNRIALVINEIEIKQRHLDKIPDAANRELELREIKRQVSDFGFELENRMVDPKFKLNYENTIKSVKQQCFAYEKFIATL